ncbi:efflux RND transporter permease subunit, partial [Bradyrhizobium sp.]|uniref:efflux RND transporter permease subunit n=1 Tax=Bradyrhizobium sp. TaxID=376 RepID=UPI003C7C6302
AINQLRTPLVTVPGAAIPYPYGGKQRQIQIDVNPTKLQSLGLSGQDVANALAAQNLIQPAGTSKIGGFEYVIQVNNSPLKAVDMGDLPIKVVNGATVYIRDVANVRDGNPPQTNVVHVNGNRSVLMMVLKSGYTSTLDIIAGIKKKAAAYKDSLPDTLKIGFVGDQGVFVAASIEGVVREGVIAALLTSVMILLFLGSWRSTIIIATSIPLAVFGSIVMLAAIGETLNIMTLGGLALAVGILVDEATVTIENINWHLEQGKDVRPAILDGAEQIVVPAFVSLLCICIVFIPMFFLQGIPRFLFVPMAEAVIFAMIWSFILSRTLVPTMAMYLLKPHQHEHGAALPPTRNPLVWFQRGFEARFERFRNGYRDLLMLALRHRPTFVIGFLGFIAASFVMVPYLGQNFFPSVDAGQILMHVRLQVGTRLEESANQFTDIEKAIRKIIPPDQIETMADNIGMPISGINMTYNNTGVMGPQDGDVQIKLVEDHPPTENYVKAMREQLPRLFPGATFAFLPADIVNQILNFGSPAPIDLEIRGNNLNANFAYADDLLKKIRLIPGVADARIQQSMKNPTFDIDVDRTRAQYVGLTERDVVNSLTVNLSGSGQVAPTYYLNPDNGVNYSVVMQTPQYQIDSISALETLPITSNVPTQAPILGGVASIKRTTSSAMVSQYDIQPMVQIFATPQGRDLGGIATEINKVIANTAKDVPKGSTVALSGQVQTMNSSFSGLLFGLLGAIVLVYFLIVVNFQSWSDPFVIITALPAALAGIVWILFTTHTTMSVPALTGAIMCMGVATANSVLVISFARERYDELGDPVAAAIEAGFVRIRPVLMTALAMIIGMLPMSLGLGDGGEANAPLGRAVIGGLMFSTVATLMFVPVVFSMLHKKQDAKAAVPSETKNAH